MLLYSRSIKFFIFFIFFIFVSSFTEPTLISCKTTATTVGKKIIVGRLNYRTTARQSMFIVRCSRGKIMKKKILSDDLIKSSHFMESLIIRSEVQCVCKLIIFRNADFWSNNRCNKYVWCSPVRIRCVCVWVQIINFKKTFVNSNVILNEFLLKEDN